MSFCFVRAVFAALLVALVASPARAQDGGAPTAATAVPARALTLEAAVARARAEGPDARVARFKFEQARWDVRAFRTRLRPKLVLSGSAPGLERSITDVPQDDGSVRYVEQNFTSSRANLNVEQELPFTGGTLTVGSRLGRVDRFGAQAFGQWQTTPVTLGLRQPLFQFNDVKWARRLEPLSFEIARQTYAEDVAQVAETTAERFFAVVRERVNLDIARFNVAVNDTIYALAQGRYEIGTIAENDLLETELALLNAQNAAAQAAIDLEQARRALKLALGLPPNASLSVESPSDLPEVSVTPEQAVAEARPRRAAFLDLRRRVVAADRDVARAKSGSGFGGTLTASYGLSQTGSALDNAYQNLLDQQQLQVRFRLPLYRWGEGRAAVEAARAARQATAESVALKEKELEQRIYFEVVRLGQLRDQVAIAAKADTVGRRRFEVARGRYEVGNITITDLFNAQREKDTARRGYLQTLQSFWTSYYRLRRLTLYDFARNTPVDPPRPPLR